MIQILGWRRFCFLSYDNFEEIEHVKSLLYALEKIFLNSQGNHSASASLLDDEKYTEIDVKSIQIKLSNEKLIKIKATCQIYPKQIKEITIYV